MVNCSTEVNYYKIGLFVLAGFCLTIAGLLVFGTSKLFERTIYIETYFNESVQGISVGSPVKYRGMQIGYVKRISFASEIYQGNDGGTINSNSDRYIYVKMAITAPIFTSLSSVQLKDMLAENVAAGLRIKLAQQGLTGIAYLELNYVDPKHNSQLPINWRPKDYYIPSSPSLMTEFTDNVQSVFNQLKEADVKKLFENIASLATSAKRISEKTDHLLSRVDSPIETTVLNLKVMSENMRMLSEQLKNYPGQLLFGGPPNHLDLNKI